MTNVENNVRLSEAELEALRMKIRKVNEVDLEALSAECENNNVFPKEMWEIGKKNDMFRLSLPVKYGGMGLCFEQYFTLLEEIARGNGGMRMFWHVANGLSWEIMCERGSEEMKNKYLPLMGTGDFFTAFALTEKDCGSGADIRTTATKQGDKWILNGSKTLISFTDVCNAYYIIAVSDESKRHTKGGHTAFFVPADSKGLRVENMPHMMGCRGAGHGDVILENVEIPDKYRMGNEGEGLTVFMHALAISRASIGVCLLGMSPKIPGDGCQACQGPCHLWQGPGPAPGHPAAAGRYGHPDHGPSPACPRVRHSDRSGRGRSGEEIITSSAEAPWH